MERDNENRPNEPQQIPRLEKEFMDVNHTIAIATDRAYVKVLGTLYSDMTIQGSFQHVNINKCTGSINLIGNNCTLDVDKHYGIIKIDGSSNTVRIREIDPHCKIDHINHILNTLYIQGVEEERSHHPAQLQLEGNERNNMMQYNGFRVNLNFIDRVIGNRVQDVVLNNHHTRPERLENEQNLTQNDREIRGKYGKRIKIVEVNGMAESPNSEESEVDCAICFDKVKKSEVDSAFVQCFHWFHFGCLQNSLKFHNNCPICRLDVDSVYRVKSR